MSSFRDQVRDDIVNEFLNPEIFADLHHINGKPMYCILDMDERTQSKNAAPYGVSEGGLALFASEADLPRGHEGDRIDIDGTYYTVKVWRTDMGMHRVTLDTYVSY